MIFFFFFCWYLAACSHLNTNRHQMLIQLDEDALCYRGWKSHSPWLDKCWKRKPDRREETHKNCLICSGVINHKRCSNLSGCQHAKKYYWWLAMKQPDKTLFNAWMPNILAQCEDNEMPLSFFQFCHIIPHFGFQRKPR